MLPARFERFAVPTLEFERTIGDETGFRHVAGLDEAGRGAIAGPVVAAAVILPLNCPDRLKLLNDVNDSKRLSARVRERLFDVIVENALAYGVGSIAAAIIDDVGIIAATKQAMTEALAQLQPAAEYLLIDGRIRLQNTPLPQQSIIRGDGRSLSVAAASILAKVSRDRHMVKMDEVFPGYGLARHKGYGTRRHIASLAALGATPIHRHSFAPLRRSFF